MSNTRWSAWPAGLLVGLSLQVVTAWGAALGLLASRLRGDWYVVLGITGAIAGLLLSATGSLELARRLPRARARYAQIAAAGFALAALAALALEVALFSSSRDLDGIRLAWAWVAGLVVASIGIAALSRIGGALLIAVAIFIVPPPPIADALYRAIGDSIIFYLAGMWTVWSVLALVIVSGVLRRAAAPPEQNALAAGGFRHAKTALWIRLGSASLLSSAAGIQVVEVQRFGIVAGSIAGAASMVLFALALLRVASTASADHPRIRLNIAAFLAIWGAVAWSLQAFYNYRTLGMRDAAIYDKSPTWFLSAPIVATLAIGVLILSIERLARSASDEKLERTAATTKVAFLSIMGLSIVLLAIAGPSPAVGLGHLYALIFGTSFTVCALVLAASLCGKAAKAIEDRPGLATASLRER